MLLLSEELKARLPPLGQSGCDPDPMVYARLFLPGTSWNFYVIEAGIEAGYWVVFCLFVTNERVVFSQFPLDLLEELRSEDGQALVLDPNFREGQLTDVVPAPEL
jgi:hypothetical protein